MAPSYDQARSGLRGLESAVVLGRGNAWLERNGVATQCEERHSLPVHGPVNGKDSRRVDGCGKGMEKEGERRARSQAVQMEVVTADEEPII